MNISPEGIMSFSDVFDLTYELFNELEFEVRSDGTIMDTVGNNILSFNGMILKASINPYQINYPGAGEISCDILDNVRLTNMLFGLYLERKQQEGMPFRSFYPHEITDNDDIKYSNLTLKYNDYDEISTQYYHNKCLKFIEMIFLLDEERVDLKNFDSIIEDN